MPNKSLLESLSKGDSSGPFQAHPVMETRGCWPACGSRNRVQGAPGAPPFGAAPPRGSELTSSAVHRLRARQEAVTSAQRDQSGPSGRPCLGTGVCYLVCYLGIHFQTRVGGAAVGTRASSSSSSALHGSPGSGVGAKGLGWPYSRSLQRRRWYMGELA